MCLLRRTVGQTPHSGADAAQLGRRRTVEQTPHSGGRHPRLVLETIAMYNVFYLLSIPLQENDTPF